MRKVFTVLAEGMDGEVWGGEGGQGAVAAHLHFNL